MIESTFIFNEVLPLNCQFLTSLNRTESDQPFILFEKGKLSPDGRNFQNKLNQTHFAITFCILIQTVFFTGFRLAVLLLLLPASSLGKDSFVKRLCFVGVLLLREWVNFCKASSFD